MFETIKIKKGVDIPLAGHAKKERTEERAVADFAVKPTDFIGVVPKLLVAEGDAVKAGSPLFYDKNNESARFTAPVSGTVKAIVRGAKRAIQAVVVASDGKYESLPFEKGSAEDFTRQQIIDTMVASGLWTMVRQRPFGTIANVADTPKAIFVSCFDSAPLAADYDFALQGREAFFTSGVALLAKLSGGKLHLSYRKGQKLAQGKFPQNVEVHFFEGPHPAGNVGTQIAAIDPINKGEVVWVMTPEAVSNLGRLFSTGEYRPERCIAFAGPKAANPRYYHTIMGASVESMCKEQQIDASTTRLISGNVLSGTKIATDGYLGAFDSLLSAIPEGNYYDFMGWIAPGFRKFSLQRTFCSAFTAFCGHRKSDSEDCEKDSRYNMDTNFHGGPRPLVLTGNFEKVFPFKIYPLQLIKAAVIGDIDLMENLGIYEVEPEDFALCEFMDPSKTEIQTIIREALETIRKEAM